MSKTTDIHGNSRARDIFLPIATLGFYGLRRFRPRWLHTVAVVLPVALWLTLAFVAGNLYNNGEYLVAPLVFVMAVVAFVRLLPGNPRRAHAHHR